MKRFFRYAVVQAAGFGATLIVGFSAKDAGEMVSLLFAFFWAVVSLLTGIVLSVAYRDDRAGKWLLSLLCMGVIAAFCWNLYVNSRPDVPVTF